MKNIFAHVLVMLALILGADAEAANTVISAGTPQSPALGTDTLSIYRPGQLTTDKFTLSIDTISSYILGNNPDLSAIEALSSTGIPVRTATNTWAQRALAITSGTGLSITNGNGVSGNPTIAGLDATTSTKGVVSLNSANFATSSGDVTIKTGGVGATEIASTAVTAGSYYMANATVDADGRITSMSNGGNVYFTANNTCNADVTSDIEAFALLHGGIVNVLPGCYKFQDVGSGIVTTSSFKLNCLIPGTCTYENPNDHSSILYWVPDNIALDSKQLVSAIGSATINSDDILYYVTVSDASTYSRGDYVLLTDSIGVPDDAPSTKSISSITWDSGNSKCVVTTSASHGYSDSHQIFIKSVTASGGAGSNTIGALSGSDSLGRTYNITRGDGAGANLTTKFTLQYLNNSTATTAGTDVDCSGGTYTSGGVTARQVTWAAEGNRVAGADLVLNRVYFTNKPKLLPLYVIDSASGNVPVLYRYTQAREFSINGFKGQAFGTPDFSTSTSQQVIDVMGVPNAQYSNLTFYDTWDAGIFSRGNPGSVARNLQGVKLPNRGTQDPSASIKTITDVTVASQAVFTSATHGFSNGGNGIYLSGFPTGWTSLNGTICRVSDATTNTFKCKDTYGNYIDSSTFAAFSGTSSAGAADNVTGLGYLMSNQSACFNCVTDGMTLEEGRHGFTTGTSQLSWAASLTSSAQIVRFGVPTYFTVRNVKALATNGRTLDTHEASYGGVFENWDISYPQRGTIYGSYEGAWGQDRGGDSTFNNINVIGGKKGLRIVANDKFKPMTFNFNHISCNNTVSTDGTDNCIEIQNWDSFTNKPTVYLNDIQATSVSIPILIGKTAKVIANGPLAFRDFDEAVDCGAGATFESTNGFSMDFRDPGRESGWAHKTDNSPSNFHAILMRSDVTNGGCSATVMNATGTQGTGSNKLTNFFFASDTTATKYYYLGQYNEFDPSGVGNSTLTSTATTMTKRTDIFTSNASMAFQSGAALQTRKTAGETLLLQAYDVDGASYTTFGTLTANNTPTLDLSSAVTLGGVAIQTVDAELTAWAGLTSAADTCGYFTGSGTASTFICTSSGRSFAAAASAAAETALLSAMVGDSGSGGTKGLVPAPASGDAAAAKFLKADGTWAVPAGGGGISDGDKGDITVSSSGAVWSIDTGVVGPTQLASTAVAAGSYTGANITVDADGRITAASNGGGGGTFPGSSTDNAAVRFDGTGGSTVQNSGVIIDDSNNVSGVGTLASAAHTITSTSATSLVVGPNGATNPAFQVDSSTASAATGIKLTAAASGGGFDMTATGGTNENLTIQAKGTGTLSLKGTGTSTVDIRSGAISVTSNKIALAPGSSGTATTQRFLFTAPADTSITAGTEAIDVQWNLSATRQHASNTTIALQRDFLLQGTAHSFASATGTITDAAAFAVAGGNCTTNATCTNYSGVYIPTFALTNASDAYGLNVAAPSGATRNWAARISGQVLNVGTGDTIAAGAGAGTSPTISIAGAPLSSKITLTTGVTPTGSNATIATVTYPNACPTGSIVVYSPSNANASGLAAALTEPYATGTTTAFTLVSGTTGLTGATAYTWDYHVTCY